MRIKPIYKLLIGAGVLYLTYNFGQSSAYKQGFSDGVKATKEPLLKSNTDNIAKLYNEMQELKQSDEKQNIALGLEIKLRQ